MDPHDVWRVIQRADDLVKYAPNRDPATAYAQARALLDDAETSARDLDDPAIRARFERLIALRRDDIARAESGS